MELICFIEEIYTIWGEKPKTLWRKCKIREESNKITSIVKVRRTKISLAHIDYYCLQRFYKMKLLLTTLVKAFKVCDATMCVQI